VRRAAFNPNSLLIAAAIVLLGAVAAFAGYYSGGSNRPAAVADPSEPPVPVRGAVQSVTADSLTLQTDTGSRSLRLTPDTSIEALRPVAVSAVRPGDWLNAGALPHRQTLFALTGLVILPDGSYQVPSR
jgi:hypothetical protein